VSYDGKIRVEFTRDIHLPDVGLWLDPRRSKPFAFVSHAHSDHVARHQQILCSPVTAHLLKIRYRINPERMMPCDFFQAKEIAGFRYTLLPAGHIAGSAMIHITCLNSGATLLYTGDYKLRSSRTVETASWLKADTLIMESTFGLPRYVLPPAEEIEKQIVTFVSETIERGDTPILLGYSLGKAQEIAAILAAYDLPFLSAASVATMTEACRKVGMPLPEAELFHDHVPRGFSLIAPPQALRLAAMAKLPRLRSAIMTGWAIDPGARFRYRTDATIPLSDHADYPDLLRTVELVEPENILTVHGSTRELAAALRNRNHNAWSIHGDDQLELPLV
jgi:DNA ligase-1